MSRPDTERFSSASLHVCPFADANHGPGRTKRFMYDYSLLRVENHGGQRPALFGVRGLVARERACIPGAVVLRVFSEQWWPVFG